MKRGYRRGPVLRFYYLILVAQHVCEYGAVHLGVVNYQYCLFFCVIKANGESHFPLKSIFRQHAAPVKPGECQRLLCYSGIFVCPKTVADFWFQLSHYIYDNTYFFIFQVFLNIRSIFYLQIGHFCAYKEHSARKTALPYVLRGKILAFNGFLLYN